VPSAQRLLGAAAGAVAALTAAGATAGRPAAPT
jgi:hypothetical protein